MKLFCLYLAVGAGSTSFSGYSFLFNTSKMLPGQIKSEQHFIKSSLKLQRKWALKQKVHTDNSLHTPSAFLKKEQREKTS